MTKKITIIFLFCFSYSFSQQKDTIYGNVKSVTEYLYCKDNNSLKPYLGSGCRDTSTFNLFAQIYNIWIDRPTHTSLNYFKEFNKNGKVIKEVWIDRFKDTTQMNYLYDKNSNLIQEKKTYWDGETTTKNFNYVKNKIKSCIYFDSDEPTSFYFSEYVYDSILNLTNIKRFNELGQTESYIYKYDDFGNKIKEIIHSPFVYIKEGNTIRGKKDSIGLYKLLKKHIYNNKNQLLETLNFDAYSSDNHKSKFSGKYKYEYNNNNLLSKTYSITDTINSVREYNYDSKNRIIKNSFKISRDTTYISSFEYFYNDDGHIEKIKYTNKDGEKLSDFSYILDSNKNWIKIIKSIKGKELFILTRKIEYFD